MRIVVNPHTLEIGGSQLNAIELAAAVRDLGHDVSVFASDDGPLSDVVGRLGLRLDIAARWKRRPSRSIADELTRLVRAEGVDIVHAYEWPPCLEVFAGPYRRGRVPMLGTVMSMGVSPLIPPSVPLVVGTEQIAAASRSRPGAVHVLEPPVDTDENRPLPADDGVLGGYGLDPGRLTVVVVSRLATELKREGIERAVGAVELVAASGCDLQLLVVGDGPDRDRIAGRADAANRRMGVRRIALAGELADPRPAYATADVVLGMGGSALRAMAFAKPLVVLGERGFSEVLEPGSWERFLWSGFFGLGDGDLSPDRLAAQIAGLLSDHRRRELLGGFARRLVEERFSLRRAAGLQEALYRETCAAPLPAGPRLTAEWAVATARVFGSKVSRRLGGLRSRRPVDDCNSLEAMARTAARAGAPPPVPVGEER